MLETLQENAPVWLGSISDLVVAYAGRLIGALAILIIGQRLVRWALRGIESRLKKKSVDPAVMSFGLSFGGVALRVLLLFAIISVLGVPTSGFVAVIGAAGLAVGMALSGTLSNLAGGVVLLVLRPFNIGHVIEAQGMAGVVHGISVFHTVVKTFDNQTVFVPNGKLANDTIVNKSLELHRRVDFTFDVAYDSDLASVRRVLEDVIGADSRVLHDPAKPLIGVSALGVSSVEFLVRVWVPAVDLVDFPLEFREAIKRALDREGIAIPFPQLDVHFDGAPPLV